MNLVNARLSIITNGHDKLELKEKLETLGYVFESFEEEDFSNYTPINQTSNRVIYNFRKEFTLAYTNQTNLEHIISEELKSIPYLEINGNVRVEQI